MAVDLLVPEFRYYPRRVVVDANVNDQFVFREQSGTDLIATVAAGEYDYGELAFLLERALEAAGYNDYTVTYSYATRSFTLTSDGSVYSLFEIRTGATSRDGWGLVGITSDKTGSLSYVSDVQVPQQVSLQFTRPVKQPRLRFGGHVGELQLEGGRREVVAWGYQSELIMTAEWEPRSVAVGWERLLREVGVSGGAVEFYPSHVASDWVSVQVAGDRHDISDMSAEGVYGYYRIQLQLLEVVPYAGTIRLHEVLDRGPTA